MNRNDPNFDFDDFVRKTLRRSDLLIRAVCIKTFSSVIKDTPVGNPDLWKSQANKPLSERRGPAGYVGGRLRANWNCSLSAPSPFATDSTDKEGSIPKMESTVATGNRRDVFWLANNLPYAHRIEYDGWSSQARAGMVRRNVARIKRNIQNELNRIKAQS